MYVELHSRSAFSFLEGASLPEALALTAAQLDIPAMALLDRNGFYGSARFHMAGNKTGIRAHVGTELSVSNETGTMNYPLLCESQLGYQNLCRLITRTKLRVPKHSDSSAQLSELQEHTAGLICLTGDEHGPLAHALRNGGTSAGRDQLNKLKAIFGPGNIYVELQRHFLREQEQRNQCAIELARELSLPLLATNGVSYASAADREVLDVFTCIKNKRQLVTGGRLLCTNAERHIRTPERMAQIFADVPEAIANTTELSTRLQFTLKDLGYQFPSYPVPSGETMDSFLYARTWEGAHRRYQPITDRVTSQLDRELKLIAQLGLAGYFLIVWDIVRHCNQNGILVQGRGSAANSAVCYSLGLTAVDPIGMDLLFERFLSEERGEWPDIDLDLPSGDDREKAIQYVYQRYGQLGAAMTANVITYRGRLAAREVGKVFGFDTETLNRVSAMVGNFEWRGPNDTFDKHFTTAGLDLTQKRIAKYLDLCERLQDMPRHLSQHSGGMVICQGQLDTVVPLEPATMPNRVVVQWDKDDCADLGIVKVDLLGLGMMAVLKDSIAMRLNLSPVKYSKPEQGWDFIANVVRQLQTLPEVQNVGAATLLPLTPGDWNTLFSGEGLPVPHSFAEVPVVRNVQVTPDYFRAIGATLRQGRYFTDHDKAKSPLVVIVNETLAHKFWPNGDALGKKFSPRPPEALIGLPPGTFPKFTIIGIIADMLHDGLDKQAKPTVYIPYLQAGQDTQLSLYLVLQMKTGNTSSLTQVLDRIHAVDSMLPVADVQTMGQRIAGSLASRSRIMWLLSIFAGSALLLAMVGVYGFFSSYVTQRTREVGLRMALGASGYDLLWLVLRQAGLLTGVGIVLGTILGFILAELSKGLFFGVKPLNLMIYLGTSLLLLCVSLLGAYGPAKRASHVDPMQALRYE